MNEFALPEIKLVDLKIVNGRCRGKKCRQRNRSHRDFLKKGERVLRLKFWNAGGEARILICKDCIPDILEQFEKVKEEYEDNN